MDGFCQLLEDLNISTVQIAPSISRRRLRASVRIKKFAENLDTYVVKKVSSRGCGPLSLSDRAKAGMFDDSEQGVYGDFLLNDIMQIMTEYNNGREAFALRLDQQIMVSHIISAFLPFIYKHTLEANKTRILKMLKIDRIKEQMVIVASRRVGKTTCIAIVAASIMIAVPNCEGAIFALAQRASRRVMQMIINFLKMHPRGQKLYDTAPMKNTEQLILIGDHPSHRKILHAFPDTPNVCPSPLSPSSSFLFPFQWYVFRLFLSCYFVY